MKKLLFISITVITVLSGCNKFLDKEPDNRAKLETPEKVSQLLGSAYPQLSYLTMAELSTDNVDDLVTLSLDAPDWIRLSNDLYTFEDNNGSATSEDTPEGYWFGCYRAIAAANLALEAIEKASDKSLYTAQKGEALVARAYAHFMLVNFFAKFYNPATAATDLGIPYVTEPEEQSIKKYNRGTVQQVYDKIEDDLQQGLPLIDDNSYAVRKYHFNKAAANAFASRYYLHKKEMDSVIKYSIAAIPEAALKNNLRPWNTVYIDLDLNGNGSLSQVYGKATENANLLLAESRSWYWRYTNLGRYSTSPELVDYIGGDAHISNAPWSYRLAYYLDNHSVVPKIEEYFVETTLGSGIGDGWTMVTLFSVEEVLFNLAEAYTYKGENAKAINLLNVYLSTRIDGYNAATDNLTESKIQNFYANSGNAYLLKVTPFTEPTALTKGLINILLDYKQVEFNQEGLRWFDILRYGIVVKHNIYKNTQRDIERTITLDVNNVHRVFQIPAAAISQSGLQSNR